MYYYPCGPLGLVLLKPAMSNKIRLRIHHVGKLVETPVKWYVNGEVTEMNWSWDVGYMSYMELKDMIKSEGYVNIKCLWYWNPTYSFSRGLKPLNNDQDVLQFLKDVVGYNVIDVYVEHNVGIPEIIDDSELDVELDVEDDVQCTGFKSADITEEVTIDPNIVAELGTIYPNGVAEDDVTTDPNIVVEEGTIDPNGTTDPNGVAKDDVITDPNVIAGEGTTDPNGVTEDDVTTDPNVIVREGTTDIDEDYVASEGSFEDNEFQFSEEYEESEMDWTKGESLKQSWAKSLRRTRDESFEYDLGNFGSYDSSRSSDSDSLPSCSLQGNSQQLMAVLNVKCSNGKDVVPLDTSDERIEVFQQHI
ncbi:hypothetical protein KIW84_014676 [Lathyrus oleraceus]|uniref:PB1-like domain-containing protein n=1 Tax=Pisum sativum TaxID=3888 RepID=A0A9D5BNH3_PEA|nr:hypothetical protein KIW84_014676 [Pisum sativum]